MLPCQNFQFCSLLKSSTKTGSHVAPTPQTGSSSWWVEPVALTRTAVIHMCFCSAPCIHPWISSVLVEDELSGHLCRKIFSTVNKVWCLSPPSGTSPENGNSGLRQRCAVSFLQRNTNTRAIWVGGDFPLAFFFSNFLCISWFLIYNIRVYELANFLLEYVYYICMYIMLEASPIVACAPMWRVESVWNSVPSLQKMPY